MKTEDMIRALYGLEKKGLFVNHQERKLMKDAAERLRNLDNEIGELRARVTELEYLLAEREGIQDADDVDPFAPAPGEAAEDFWEESDDFWAEDSCE